MFDQARRELYARFDAEVRKMQPPDCDVRDVRYIWSRDVQGYNVDYDYITSSTCQPWREMRGGTLERTPLVDRLFNLTGRDQGFKVPK